MTTTAIRKKEDVFFARGHVWVNESRPGSRGVWLGLEPASGEVRTRLEHGLVRFSCQRMVATDQFHQISRQGSAIVAVRAALVQVLRAMY